MAEAKPDPRLNAWRDDMAAAHLRGEVDAPIYVEGEAAQIIAPVTALRRTPADGAMQDTQLLYGEGFHVYDVKHGWAWGQSVADDYVGYVLAEDVGVPLVATHRLAVQRSFIYSTPDIKTRPLMGVSVGAQLSVKNSDGKFGELNDGGFIYAAHLSPLDSFESEPVAVAQRFIGAPYFWGGRESSGLDCSALVQLALQACGQACPRDTYMQQAVLGRALGADEAPLRGDIVFWKGHVGFLTAPDRLLHANAHHMAVIEEGFASACARIEKTDGPVLVIKRL
jgi:cell wall-associated NlpC family hydrolase